MACLITWGMPISLKDLERWTSTVYRVWNPKFGHVVAIKHFGESLSQLGAAEATLYGVRKRIQASLDGRLN